MIHAICFKGIGGLEKHEQGRHQVVMIEKKAKHLWLGATLDSPITKNGDLHSSFALTTRNKA